ncbi:Uncharacterized protein SCP_0304920 [Sparassis crispa]|uniref:Rit1 N-terminal domain-containing protein n=1 Tax=Sparassis crispa TaxID=139825 RepID=A0A401GF93_9APHY|nr:Uncharacterized protein SCP_0304920 [Sparassis crispa]GBE80773.1 Uncharacterized protein SCP_0304920 [Sparassis crispa]
MPVAHGLEYGSHRDIAALAFAYLHKESLDIYNRLHSIEEDVAFVTSVCSSYPHLPVLPNLRCGAWYVDPSTARREPAYFKSTDGHYGNWSFNLRRPNLHLLQVALSEGGLIIVDSTRSGKRIPDALSKTVPIWCTVVNRAIRSLNPMTQKRQWDTALCCPPGVVSSQEMAQIEERIDGWVDSLLASSYVLPDLAFPLKPLWITPSTTVLPQVTSAALRNYLPVICVSASRSMSEGLERRRNGFAYVPGSGDDHELWGVGLTPQLFWQHKTVILKAIRSDLPTLVGSLVKESPSRSRNDCWTLLPTPIFQVGGSILVGAISDLPLALPSHLPESGADIAFVLISGNSTSEPLDDPGFDAPGTVLQLRLSEGKKEQLHFLRNVLPKW